jgi:hypothetical protein
VAEQCVQALACLDVP